MKKLLCLLLVCLSLTGCGAAAAPASVSPRNDAAAPDAAAAGNSEAESSLRDVGDGYLKIDRETTPEGVEREYTDISVLYINGHETMAELLADTALIVRATPVSIEVESHAGICWVLDVAAASDGVTKTVKLRQMKDEFMLRKGEEVVLALKKDHREDENSGYYCIPGGGDGLFRTSTGTGRLDGKLLNSLLDMEGVNASKTPETTQELYNRLVAAYRAGK